MIFRLRGEKVLYTTSPYATVLQKNGEGMRKSLLNLVVVLSLVAVPASAGVLSCFADILAAPYYWVFGSSTDGEHQVIQAAAINAPNTPLPAAAQAVQDNLRSDRSLKSLAKNIIALYEGALSPMALVEEVAKTRPELTPLLGEVRAALVRKNQRVVWAPRNLESDGYDRRTRTIQLSPVILSSPFWLADILVTVEHYSGHDHESFIVTRRNMPLESFVSRNYVEFSEHEAACIMAALERALQLEKLGLTQAALHFKFDIREAGRLLKEEGDDLEYFTAFLETTSLGRFGNYQRMWGQELRFRWQQYLAELDREYIETVFERATSYDEKRTLLRNAVSESLVRKAYDLPYYAYLTSLFPNSSSNAQLVDALKYYQRYSKL